MDGGAWQVQSMGLQSGTRLSDFTFTFTLGSITAKLVEAMEFQLSYFKS